MCILLYSGEDPNCTATHFLLYSPNLLFIFSNIFPAFTKGHAVQDFPHLDITLSSLFGCNGCCVGTFELNCPLGFSVS